MSSATGDAAAGLPRSGRAGMLRPMSAELTLPALSAPVREAFAAFPERQRCVLLDARDPVFAAAEDSGIGPLIETLKWGEPAYLTETTGSGSTLRLGVTRQGRVPAMFVNCRTTLIEEIRARCGDRLGYEGTRAVLLPPVVGADADAVRNAAHLVLTYHARRRAR